MNLFLLPKELQDLIGEFNIEYTHKMRLLMDELIVKHKELMNKYNHCDNCGDYSDEKYSTYIFWNKYTFCGEFCKYDLEYDIRKSYMKRLRRKNNNHLFEM